MIFYLTKESEVKCIPGLKNAMHYIYLEFLFCSLINDYCPTRMYGMLKLGSLEGTEREKCFLKDRVFPFFLKRKLWVCSDTCGFSSRFGFGAAGGVTVRLSVCFSSASTCGLIV